MWFVPSAGSSCYPNPGAGPAKLLTESESTILMLNAQSE